LRRLPALLVAALAIPALAQEGYWVALNYRVTLYGNGTALVEAKLHPFSLDGRSLFGSAEVERDLNSSVQRMLTYTLLMFSDNPRLLRYELASYSKVPGEVVLCDVANTGALTEFRGAYVLAVRIYLNTSSYVRVLNGSLIEVKVRDSFTSVDVRSWIDVVEFRFEGAELVGYRWEPPFARGPRNASPSSLLWVNFNELEAPDFYVFTLRAPGFRCVGEPPEVEAKIASAACSGRELRVVVRNTGSRSGYAYVVAASGGVEQARKVYLRPGEEREVAFPSLSCTRVALRLYSGGALLEERALEGGGAAGPAQPPLAPLLLLAAVAALSLAAWWRRRALRRLPAAPVSSLPASGF